MKQLKQMFNKPKIIGIVSNVNEGKSNMIYYFIEELLKGECEIYSYGLRKKIEGVTTINKVSKLERIKGGIIFVDEMMSLFDLDNRKNKKSIEETLRLINHHNNILVLTGLGESFKKFLSAKLNMIIYKQITFADLINGSVVKNRIMEYKEIEKGSEILALEKNEALIYDDKIDDYYKIIIPYMEQYDTKLDNKPIFVQKKRAEKVCKNVPKKQQV